MKKFAGDIIILHMCTKNYNHNDVWFMWYGVRQTEFFVIMDRFLPFCLPMDTKNQNYEKLKKTLGDIILLQMCPKDHDHMLYCSLDMACNRFNYFSLWVNFYSFTSLTAQKIKIYKKWTSLPPPPPRRYYHFTKVYQKSWSYATLFLRYGAWQM